MEAGRTENYALTAWHGDFSRHVAGWRWFLRNVLAPFAYTRLLLLFAGWFALTWLPGARQDGWNRPTSYSAINMWSHCDSRWYLSIARDGYQLTPNEQSNIAFAPLYALLMRVGGWIGGGSDSAFLIAGIIIANVSLIAAVAYLVALMQMEGYDEATAGRAGWYLLVFPTSFFFSAAYPMSLFIALAIGAFYAARRDQWRIAGLLVGLATLSRPDGVMLCAGLAVEYWQQHKFSLKHGVLWLASGPAAVLGWMAYQWYRFGDPLAFVHIQKEWGSYPLQTLLHSQHGTFQLAGPVLFAVLIVMAIRHLRPGYIFYAVAMFAVMLAAPRYCSITRYIIVLFPVYMMLAIVARRWRFVHLAFTAPSLLVSVLLMIRFTLCLWVA